MRRVSFIRLGRVANPAPAALALLGEGAVHLRHNPVLLLDNFLTCVLYLLSILAAGGVCLDCCVAGQVEHRREETSRRAEPEVFGGIDKIVKFEISATIGLGRSQDGQEKGPCHGGPGQAGFPLMGFESR